MNPKKPHKLAVLIDADNASASAVSGLFAEIAKYGIASVKRIYGDWSRPEPQGWKKACCSNTRSSRYNNSPTPKAKTRPT